MLSASVSTAQTTYHLHNEASSTTNLKQLRTAGPDVATAVLQTVNLKSTANGEKVIKDFDTPAGVPGVAGTIGSGSTLTFQLWMKKTANVGTLFPRARVSLNNASGTAFCTATGTSALTTTLTKYTISCTTTAPVTLTATSRLFLRTAVNMTAGSTSTNFAAELDVEGTLNGSADSQVAIPNILLTPTIASLTPETGAVGAAVTIAGTNFGASQGSSTVKFNGTIATATSWSATSIVVTVPAGATSGNVIVSVSSQASNGRTFSVLATPTITSLSPTSGAVGVQVTINGTGFGATRGPSTVTFNGTLSGTPTSWNNTQIKVNVPAGAAGGNVVVHAAGVHSNGSPFTVLATPTITSLSAPSGVVDDVITVTGTNFGAMQGTSTIKFNGTTAAPTSWTDTSIVTPVPASATSGNIVVAVNGVNSAGASFVVFVAPTITSTSPTSSAVGGSVTINGSGFQANQGIGSSTVTFNGVAATPTSWNNTQIKAPVPAGATTGGIVVTVGGLASDERFFTVKPSPVIWSASPMFGAVGIQVTIAGTNFGNTQGSSTVKFNGTTATPTSWSSTRIGVNVPSGATTGNLVLRTSNVDLIAGLFKVVTITSLTIEPPNLTVPRESVQRLRAMATYSDSSTQDIGSVATWQTTVPTVGTIDSPGVVRAVAQSYGETGVQATFGAFSASTTLTFSGGSFSSVGASLLKPRWFHTSTMLDDGRILVAGGDGWVTEFTGPLSSAEIYDPINRTIAWTGSLTTRRAQHGAVKLPDGKVLLFGGSVPHPFASDYSIAAASAELYDPATGTFSSTGSLNYARAGNGLDGVLLPNGKVLVIGGFVEFDPILSAELYDPATGTFTETGSVNVPRYGTDLILLADGTVLLVGGGNAATSERYDPATGQFTIEATLPTALTYHSTTMLPDGKLLLGGGVEDGASTSTQSLIYDLAPPQTFQRVSGLAVARQEHTATLLDNGSVLMTSGDHVNDIYRTAEIFDPVSKSYIGAGATTVSRIGHTATKLPNGTVMIIGGNVNDGLIELYGAILPTPTSLTIVPSPVTITTGTTVAFIATDDLARQRYDATWTVSDPSKASLTVTANGASLTALALGQVTLTADIDGVQAEASVTIAPQTLRITPAKATLLIGHQRQFSVVDELGRPSPLATWTLSDETLAAITPDDSSPVLTALIPGQVTLTATVLGVTMTAEVTILAGTTYPQGTVLWTAPVIAGFVPTGIVQTVMFDPDNTAAYTVQRRADNTESLVQAFTNDGRQMWERRMRPLLGEPVSDGKGGLLVTEACDSDNPVQLSALDQTTGTLKWYTQIAPQYVGTGCPEDAPRIAIRHDGAVAFSAPPNTLPSFIVVSEDGGLISLPSIPQSTAIDMSGQTIHLPATMGAPIVDGNSVIYVQYAVRQIPYPSTSIASQLYLLKILPDGTTSTVELGTSTQANLLPGSLLPDGNGGVLATWTVVKPSPPSEPEPYRAAHVSSAGAILNTYTMPYAPTTTTTGPYGLPLAPSLVLGEGGTGFAAYGSNVASFNLASGAANWNYDTGSAIRFFGYNAAAGLTLVDALSNQIGISSSGSTDWSLSLGAFSTIRSDWEGYWLVAQPSDGIALAAIETTRMEWGTSEWVTQGGSPATSSAAIPSPYFPPLAKGHPNIGPHEAIYDALDDLVERLRNDVNLRSKAKEFVLDKVAAEWGKALTVDAFVNYLGAQGLNRPRFYDGTKSTFCYNILEGGLNGFGCRMVNSLGPAVKSKFPAGTDRAAVAWTPRTPLSVFFNPTFIGLNAEGKNLGNEALIFHEALHGLTGLYDGRLIDALGWPFLSASCKINVTIQRDVLAHAPGLNSQVAQPCVP